MKNIIFKIAAVIAFLLGLMSIITGLRALTGFFDPSYTTFPLLISYNILMGLVSVITSYFIWRKHKIALSLSGFIAVGHIAVLASLITVFSFFIAPQSVKAMIFRSVVWVLIFVALFTINRKEITSPEK